MIAEASVISRADIGAVGFLTVIGGILLKKKVIVNNLGVADGAMQRVAMEQ